MTISRRKLVASGLVLATPALIGVGRARAADVRRLSLGYDQPHTTGYGIAGDIFSARLEQLSKGAFQVDQVPAGQLGQEPQMLQKIRTGDIDLIFSSTANAATVSPQSGVFSIHYIFGSDAHLTKTVADPAVVSMVREMFASTVDGAHVLTLFTLGFRNLYGKKEVHNVADIKGLKIRVQATATEDTLFPAYGAQTVHMPFGSVYTSLQTGVIDMAENGIAIYQLNKHYEVAPVMSLTQHEANNSLMWISGKLWSSLSEEQRGWMQEAANEVAQKEPTRAIAQEAEALTKLQKLGVKFVTDVDKSGFIKIAEPIQDKLVAELGPYATKILGQCRAIQA